MGCLGVHIALSDKQRDELLSFDSDEKRIDYVIENLQENWDEEHFFETEKAWDGIHRCLTEHPPNTAETNPDAGTYPLKKCILGGRQLLDDESSYIIRLIDPSEMADIAAALQPINKEWLSRRYWKHCEGAWPEYGEDDLEYTWYIFEPLKAYFEHMATTGRSMIFTVDQ